MTTEIPYQNFNLTVLRNALSNSKVNLVYSKREVPTWLNPVVSTIKKTKSPFQFWAVKKETTSLTEDLEQSLNHFNWENEENKQYFIKDICQLVELFVRLTNDTTPFISLRTIDEQYFKANKKYVSKNFHVDTSVLTLICSYCGKGTMWLENENILRDEFDREKMPTNPTIIENQNGETVKEMKVYEIAIIKGEIRANEEPKNIDFILNFITKEEIEIFNVGNGLIHSGPGYSEDDEKRLLITISTMKIPDFLKK